MIAEEELERRIIETVLQWQKDKDIAMNTTKSGSPDWNAHERARIAQGRLFVYAEILSELRAQRGVKR